MKLGALKCYLHTYLQRVIYFHMYFKKIIIMNNATLTVTPT